MGLQTAVVSPALSHLTFSVRFTGQSDSRTHFNRAITQTYIWQQQNCSVRLLKTQKIIWPTTVNHFTETIFGDFMGSWRVSCPLGLNAECTVTQILKASHSALWMMLCIRQELCRAVTKNVFFFRGPNCLADALVMDEMVISFTASPCFSASCGSTDIRPASGDSPLPAGSHTGILNSYLLL